MHLDVKNHKRFKYDVAEDGYTFFYALGVALKLEIDATNNPELFFPTATEVQKTASNLT